MLDYAVPKPFRNIAIRVCNILIVGASLLYVLIVLPEILMLPVISADWTLFFPLSPSTLLGALCVLAAFRLVLAATEAWRRGVVTSPYGSPASQNAAERFSFAASCLWFQALDIAKTPSVNSLLAAIEQFNFGHELLRRLGIEPEIYHAFVSSFTPESAATLARLLTVIEKQIRQNNEKAPNRTNSTIDLAAVLSAAYEVHNGLRAFLNQQNITPDLLGSAAEWIESKEVEATLRGRWWTRKQLGRIPGIGKSWSMAYVFYLEQYATLLRPPPGKTAPFRLIGRKREIELIESALAKRGNANVLLTGEAGAGKHAILAGLAAMIADGTVLPELEHWRMYRIDGPAIIARGETTGAVEKVLIQILNDAAAAGDIILVIDQFPAFMQSLEAAGINGAQLLTSYLESPNLHVVAIADTKEFFSTLESNVSLLRHFEQIRVGEHDPASLLEILKDGAVATERMRKNRIGFTLPALIQIRDGATRYLSGAAATQRAMDLLEEVASAARVPLIRPEMVLEYLSEKTAMPLGAIGKEEQDVLLNLETILHEYVIGQEQAIRALADAVRRARSGVETATRPLASFLFLGPTGVGKTETAKALARAYFGKEDAMVRLDMTEYQTSEDFTRLIGKHDTNQPGVLASLILEKPYAVVLLDEFEKASREVIELFLQVLDEGFFTNAIGERINARNTFIIATSNAGASFIAERVRSGSNTADLQRDLMAYVQKERIFTPELLNRFDGVIVFEPLGPDQLREVSRLMLVALSNRLKQAKNITLEITEELVEAVSRGGFEPEFGARPMRRFIQNRIEQLAARKIIAGELTSGDTFRVPVELLEKQRTP